MNSNVFSIATLFFVLTPNLAHSAQGCESGPPPSNVGCIEFAANQESGGGIGIATTKNFVYLEGMGGPTGDGKDWWANMQPDEQVRVRTQATRCGISLPGQQAEWFSKKGIDCVKGAFEIDNLNWFFDRGGQKPTDFASLGDVYKYVAEKTKGTCFKIAAKNLSEKDLAMVSSIPQDMRSNVSISEEKGQPLGVKPRGQGWQNFNSPDTHNYTLTCKGGEAGLVPNGGQSAKAEKAVQNSLSKPVGARK
jgi:hypothetical protein